MIDIAILDALEMELRQALADLLPELEGARDQKRMGDVDATIINEEIARRERLQNEIGGMLSALDLARQHWDSLIAAEYPAIPKRLVPADKYQPFKANQDTVALFNAKLESYEPATEGTVELGEGVDKEP